MISSLKKLVTNPNNVYVQYFVESPLALQQVALIMAGEQSTGTFIAVPGETNELKERHAAKVIAIEEIEASQTPLLPGFKVPSDHDGSYRRGYITLEFPIDNFGVSIPNLLSAIAGNIYELQELSGLRIMDIELPLSFSHKYNGPKFGIEGTRRLTNVYDRPILGTIVKPSIGLAMDELSSLITRLCSAGIDFIKDDELNGNPPYAPLELKVKTVMEAIERVADATGKKTMYAFNITGDIEELKRNHDTVVKMGGNCVMVSTMSIGFSGIHYLNSFSEVPIHGHRNQWGMLTRAPGLGMEFTVYQKLCRVAGVDHMHVNGLNSKFYESNESVTKSIKACMTDLFGGYKAMPVLSSMQWAGTAEQTYKAAGTVDVMHLAGGGMLAHPDGAEAGCISMRQGWEAAVKGIPLAAYAKEHIELRRAMEKYGAL